MSPTRTHVGPQGCNCNGPSDLSLQSGDVYAFIFPQPLIIIKYGLAQEGPWPFMRCLLTSEGIPEGLTAEDCLLTVCPATGATRPSSKGTLGTSSMWAWLKPCISGTVSDTSNQASVWLQTSKTFLYIPAVSMVFSLQSIHQCEVCGLSQVSQGRYSSMRLELKKEEFKYWLSQWLAGRLWIQRSYNRTFIEYLLYTSDYFNGFNMH